MAYNHNRSLSWPSESNPAFNRFQRTLSDVKLSESTSSSSLSSMSKRLVGLKKLYSDMDDLLRLPRAHQLVSQEAEWVDRALDGQISLFDACAKAKELASQTKQNAQDLFSALRRKDSKGIQSYLCSRRKSKKAIQKSLKDLTRKSVIASFEKENETTTALMRVMKEAESVTVNFLESLFVCLSGSTNKVRSSGWSLVMSKVITGSRKNVCSFDENELEMIDGFFGQATGKEDLRVEENQEISSRLKEMDSRIQDLEEELDCLFRQLIKTRVYILNLINH